MLKEGKLSHLIKEIKQNSGKEQPKEAKKGETFGKDKALAMQMVQPWERIARQKITQSFSPKTEIFFPPLGEDEETEGPIIIEAKIGGHCIYRIRKVTIPIQWNYWKAGSQEVASGFVNNSQNAEDPSRRRSNHHKKQQKPADMTGVPRHIAEHHLNVQKGCSQVRQNKRGQAADRNQAIQEEVGKLVEAGIMREVHYHDWLSNPMMVKKHDDSWRMCVDFKDLNKACPKDGYPLLEIEWKVESLCGFLFKCFLDAYKGYHQIQMAKEDEEKTAFITSQGIFCYTKMPFGLRNARATYQHLTVEADEAFKQMKQLIVELPMLVEPIEKEELIVYLAAAKETVSAVLIREREAKKMPIYFVSLALKGLEINYTSMEKLVLALVHASKYLKRYFQAHPIIVITDQPIQQVLSRPKVAGRLQKWSIELGEYAIHYRPRVSVKGQILADFIVERPEEDSSDTLMEEAEELPEPWILFTDGSSCTDGSEAGLILTNPEGMEFTYAQRFR
ncbi:reverse transcriptase domain-containing protein [Tanacetum coccineum]